MDQQILQKIEADPDLKLLKRVPEPAVDEQPEYQNIFQAAIIDLETMGLDANNDEIIEIGILWFYFDKETGILGISRHYNELNQPSKPIPEEITKITGITNQDVKGKKVDWDYIEQHLQQTHLVICHNSQFDRNFLECQTPSQIQTLIKKMPFACTIKDISWQDRGFESSKLDYLNFKLGYFYDGHRALTDCYATFNLFIAEPGSFDELKQNVKKKETLIIAQNAPFDKKDLLKQKSYRWSDGQGKLPKAWWITLSNEQLDEELEWLDSAIYKRAGASQALPQIEITARTRYSYRAQQLD